MKSVFLVSTILAAATLVQPAVAQEGALAAETVIAAHDGGEGAIVVTARRREESLQTIPAALSDTAQADLSRASATSTGHGAMQHPDPTSHSCKVERWAEQNSRWKTVESTRRTQWSGLKTK